MSERRQRNYVIKKRKWITLEEKVNVIRIHEEKIGREKGMCESSV